MKDESLYQLLLWTAMPRNNILRRCKWGSTVKKSYKKGFAFGLVYLFYGTSTLMGYSMPKSSTRETIIVLFNLELGGMREFISFQRVLVRKWMW